MSYLYGTDASPAEASLAASLLNVGIGVGTQTAQSILTGQSATRYDPKSGLPLDPGTGAIMDPATGWPATPQVIQAATNAKLLSSTSILPLIAVLGLAGAIIVALRA